MELDLKQLSEKVLKCIFRNVSGNYLKGIYRGHSISSRLSKMSVNTSVCWKCERKPHSGTYFHMWRECYVPTGFGITYKKEYERLLALPSSPVIYLLDYNPEQLYKHH